jgi:hypothetical protein
MSMVFTRKRFFKSIFGGFVAAAVTPSLVKAEEKPQSTNTLHVDSIIFQVGERQLQMAGNEKGDFQIKWLDVEEKETAPILTISKPTINTFPKFYK